MSGETDPQGRPQLEYLDQVLLGEQGGESGEEEWGSQEWQDSDDEGGEEVDEEEEEVDEGVEGVDEGVDEVKGYIELKDGGSDEDELEEGEEEEGCYILPVFTYDHDQTDQRDFDRASITSTGSYH